MSLFDRLDSLTLPKRRVLSNDDYAWLERQYAATRTYLGGVDDVERALHQLALQRPSDPPDRCAHSSPHYATSFLSSTASRRTDDRTRAIERYYAGIVSRINTRYGTTLTASHLFADELRYEAAYRDHDRQLSRHRDTPSPDANGRRDDDPPAPEPVDFVLTPDEVDARIARTVGREGLQEAGRSTVIEKLQRIASGRRAVKVGKTYVDFAHCLYFDEYFKGTLSYSSRETFHDLASALWHFEHRGDNKAPASFLTGYTDSRSTVPEGKVPFERASTGFRKIEAMTIYRNGRVRLHFATAAAAREFVAYFRIGLG